MKKIIFILIGLILTSGLCFAAGQGGAVKMSSSSTAVTTQTAQGIIESINLADIVKKLSAGISLKEEKGNVLKFLLSKPVVYGTDSKRIQLSQLKVGEKVKVRYSSNKDGSYEAQSIRLVK